MVMDGTHNHELALRAVNSGSAVGIFAVCGGRLAE